MASSSEPQVHVLLVSFRSQSFVNPLLRFGKCLASNGIFVTFTGPEIIGKRISTANKFSDKVATPIGDGFIRFEFFEEGPEGNSDDEYFENLESVGTRAILEMVQRYKQEGNPVSCLIYNPIMPWVSDIAEILDLPSAVLWVQSCASFSCYYHFFHKLSDFPSEENPKIDIELPFMPLLKHDETPSILQPHTPLFSYRKIILSQFKNLKTPFCVLMDTFQELEHDLIEYMSKFCLIQPVGPLFKYPNSDQNSDVNGDFLKAEDSIDWLDTKSPSSVVYISFGSIVQLSQEQCNELAYGLLNSDVSFLWVMKPPSTESGKELRFFT